MRVSFQRDAGHFFEKKSKKNRMKKEKKSSEAGFEPTPRFQDVISSHTS